MTRSAQISDEAQSSTRNTESTSLESALTESRGTRENAKVKASRLLVTGRLRVLKVEGNLIVAECRGDSGEVYNLGHDARRKEWRCTCPARTACSHLHALWAVTAVKR